MLSDWRFLKILNICVCYDGCRYLRPPSVWILSELFVILICNFVRLVQDVTFTYWLRVKLAVETSVRFCRMSSSKSENSSQLPRLTMLGVLLTSSASIEAETFVLLTSRYSIFSRLARLARPVSDTWMEPCTSRLAVNNKS